MKQTNPTNINNTTSKIGLLVLNFALLVAAIVGIVVLLIGLYHTLLFVFSRAWTPLFLYVAPTITLLAAASVVYTRQPVYSLLSLITVFFITILLYLYAGAEFLAFLFLIVYVGAIAILFLFVIILLQIKDGRRTHIHKTAGVLIMTAPVVVLTVLGLEDIVTNGFTHFFICSNKQTAGAEPASVETLVYFINYKFADILLFSSLLYTKFCFLLFLAALLLLAAILGSIVLAISAIENRSDKTEK